MPTEKASLTPLTDEEKFKLVCWSIERTDGLRKSAASRAAIVVSADALLLAGITFLLEQTLTSVHQCSTVTQVVLTSSIVITIILLTLSLAHATMAIASVWKTSPLVFGTDVPQQPFINPFETVRAFKSFTSFDEDFGETSKEQMLTYALGDLWLVQNLFYRRYQILRRAIKLLLSSIIPFSVSTITLLVGFFQ